MALAASALLADFSYQQKATVTGGVLASAMKVAGVFSKQAREPIRTTVSLKGGRMAHRTAFHASIIDLEAQTITSIDLQKKTYSVMTFDQMKQMMDQLSQRMPQQSNPNNITFKVSAKATGNAKQIAGLDAKELLVKMEMDATDQQSGQSGAMVIDMDVWMAPSVPGYDEVRDFYRRMAAKLDWSPGSQMAMGRPDVAKGMAEAYKEVGKMEGVPVYQTMTMNGAGGPQGQAMPRPSLAGALGLPRTQHDNGDPQAPQSLMEMTTELSDFSAGPVDDAQFAIPAGFKKVNPEMTKRGAR